MNEIKIDTEFIKLGQALKLSSLVSQGSDAKMIILDGLVKVNGEVTLERGKKLRNGDIVVADGFGEFKVLQE